MLVQGQTCEEVGHVGIQVFDNIHGALQKEDGVVIAVEEPLEGVIQIPVSHNTNIMTPGNAGHLRKHLGGAR